MSEARSFKSLEDLKYELGSLLKRPEQIQAPEGVSTGVEALDNFLLWNGFPKGELSLFISEPGLGATTILSQCCARLTQQTKWAAWIDHSKHQLCPWTLQQYNCQFAKLLFISQPSSEKELIWALREVLSSSLFEIVICDVSPFQLKRHHLVKLKQFAKRYKVAIVFKDEKPQVFLKSFYAFVAKFNSQFLEIQRAQHRPTPLKMERRAIYENFMPQLTEARKACRRRELSRLQP